MSYSISGMIFFVLSLKNHSVKLCCLDDTNVRGVWWSLHKTSKTKMVKDDDFSILANDGQRVGLAKRSKKTAKKSAFLINKWTKVSVSDCFSSASSSTCYCLSVFFATFLGPSRQSNFSNALIPFEYSRGGYLYLCCQLLSTVACAVCFLLCSCK